MGRKKAAAGSINIGTSSLILIFIILCLVTFAVLSLSTAAGEWSLAGRNAESVQGYYEADRQAVEFAAYAGKKLQQIREESRDDDSFFRLAKEAFGSYYIEESRSVGTDIDMPYDQKLQVVLALDPSESCGYRITAWHVYMAQDYEIDQSLKVWSGAD